MSIIYPCYAVCDKAVLESQRVGKVAALCEADSAFESYTSACLACLEANGDGTKNNFIVSYISNLSTDARVWCEPVGTGPEIGASSAGSTITPIPISQTQSLARRSQCPTYPSASLSTISSTGSLTSSLSSSSSISTQTSTSSYQFGYWLEYTFTLCPTRTTNAEFAYPTDCLLANYTWGCPPGYLCAPPQVNCDLEVGPPSDSYVCSPENCQSPPALDLDALTITTKANTTIYSPLALPTGYFNLDPVIFGADWGIFTGSVSVTLTSNAASSTPTSAALPTTTSATAAAAIPPKPYAWIVGPVLGAIIGVAVLVLLLFYFLRKRRSTKAIAPDSEILEKAQLDGEGVKPKEVGENQITELEGRHVVPVEMDAGYGGAEMPTAMPGIKRKPVASKFKETG